MLKKFIIPFFLICFCVNGQNAIKGTLEPKGNFSWIMLYQLKGANQIYVTNEIIENGQFEIKLPENSEAGMYRLIFENTGQKFVDFIYNKEDIDLKYDPNRPKLTTEFLSSEENNLYNAYNTASTDFIKRLDAFQLSYIRAQNDAEKNLLQERYKSLLKEYLEFHEVSLEKASGKLCQHFIASKKKYYYSDLFGNPQLYLDSEKAHYFDFVDFKNENLSNSTFISEKVIDYIFYLNRSDDPQVQTVLYKAAVKEVMEKIGSNNEVKSEVLTVLLHTFRQIKHVELLDFTRDAFYMQLPIQLQDAEFLGELEAFLRLSIGKIAPNFSWEENGVAQELHKLKKSETYIIVFWSTGCSHCLEEVPQLYAYTKENPNVKVVAVALEENDQKFKLYKDQFSSWSNVLGLKKWENEIARTYEVNATPTYFILDSDKKIISKPEFFKDVKAFYE